MTLAKFTAIIPARLASTRFPQKVLADICGKPMIIRVVERVRLAGFANVVVACDHDKVIKACAKYDIEALLTPNAETGTDRVVMAVNMLGLADDDYVINVQGDEPLINPKILSATAKALIASAAPCATPIGRINDMQVLMNPNVVKCVVNIKEEAMMFSRAPMPWLRGVFPTVSAMPEHYIAYRHYGVYAFRLPFIKAFPKLPKSSLETIESLEQLRILQAGYTIQTVCVAGEPAPAVDTPEDMQQVRALFAKL